MSLGSASSLGFCHKTLEYALKNSANPWQFTAMGVRVRERNGDEELCISWLKHFQNALYIFQKNKLNIYQLKYQKVKW